MNLKQFHRLLVEVIKQRQVFNIFLFFYFSNIVTVNETEYFITNEVIIPKIIFLTSIIKTDDLENRYKWKIEPEMHLTYSSDNNTTTGYIEIEKTGDDNAFLQFYIENSSPKYKFNVTLGKLDTGVPVVVEVTVNLTDESPFEDIIISPKSITSGECYSTSIVKVISHIIDCKYEDFSYELVDDNYLIDVNFYKLDNSTCKGGKIKLENQTIDRGKGFIGSLYYPDIICLVICAGLVFTSIFFISMRKKYNVLMKTQVMFLLSYSLGFIIFGLYSVIPTNNVCIIKTLFYQIGSVFMLSYIYILLLFIVVVWFVLLII